MTTTELKLRIDRCRRDTPPAPPGWWGVPTQELAARVVKLFGEAEREYRKSIEAEARSRSPALSAVVIGKARWEAEGHAVRGKNCELEARSLWPALRKAIEDDARVEYDRRRHATTELVEKYAAIRRSWGMSEGYARNLVLSNAHCIEEVRGALIAEESLSAAVTAIREQERDSAREWSVLRRGEGAPLEAPPARRVVKPGNPNVLPGDTAADAEPLSAVIEDDD